MSDARNEHRPYLDGLRGVAVLAVVAFHAVPLPWWLPSGARGVDLFFVLSGFCLSAPFLRGKPLDIGQFLVRRWWRIGPPYYVALIVFIVLGTTSFGYPSIVTSQWRYAGVQIWPDFGLLTIPSAPVHNLAFWTLGVEARWYLVAPFLILLFRRSRPAFFFVGLTAYAAYALSGVPDVGTLPCFMLGIVAADVRRHRLAGIGACVFLTLGVLSQATSNAEDHGFPIWHLAAFCLVLAASESRIFRWRPLCLVGVASYSIYLVHMPVLLWLSRYVPLEAAAVGSVFVGFAFWWCVERPLVAVARKSGTLRGMASIVSRSRTSAANASS